MIAILMYRLCFVGDTIAQFFSLLEPESAGCVIPGTAAHYMICPIVGIIFSAAVAQFPAFREGTLTKSVISSELYVEILSQPMVSTAPILLKLTPPEVLQ
jgi:hypothetical protein